MLVHPHHVAASKHFEHVFLNRAARNATKYLLDAALRRFIAFHSRFATAAFLLRIGSTHGTATVVA
jgi:hypothetical protein